MTKTLIRPEGIRKGDLIREEYEVPRLTDEGGEQYAIEYRAARDRHTLARDLASAHYLLDRPKPTYTPVPTEALDLLREYASNSEHSRLLADFLRAIDEADA